VSRRVDIGPGGGGNKPLWKFFRPLQCRFDKFVNMLDFVVEYRDHAA